MSKELLPGDRAPSFRLATDDGGEISSAKLKGRTFVLYFYPRDDTSGCTREAISFSEEKHKFDSLGIAIVGVSKDGVASHAKFRKKYDLAITLASDPDVETARKFGVWIEKSLYGRRYMGMDRATFLVDGRGVIRQVWRRVKVADHANVVLEAARAL